MFEPREVIITKVEWPKKDKDRIEFEFGNSVWCGACLKDFWRVNEIDDWSKVIKVGTKLRLWTHSYSSIIGFETIFNGKWVSVWCIGNDFETKAKEEASSNAYDAFVNKEGHKIAKWIDQGKTLEQIDKLMDDGHSGNTYSCALYLGIRTAKNKDNSEKIRKAHNKIYGIGEDKKGLVNSAILTITKKE